MIFTALTACEFEPEPPKEATEDDDTLDVLLYTAPAGGVEPADAQWKKVGKKALFDDCLWEPGCVAVKYVKISNKESLMYNCAWEISSGDEIPKLAEVIEVYLTMGCEMISTREELTKLTYIGTLDEVIGRKFECGGIDGGSEHTMTLALKMTESAGNEYYGLDLGEDFTLKLDAKLFAEEDDSFDDQHDA